MNDLNIYIFNFLNSGARYYPRLDMFFIFLTSYLAYSVSIVIGLYVLFIVPFRREAALEKIRAIRQGFEFVLATGLTWVFVSVIKYWVAEPRPFMVLKEIQALLPNESGYSFPSGHSALTFAVATTVYLHHKRLGIYLYAFALVVAISRVYVGVHYPIDILAGALIGIFFSLLTHAILPKKIKIHL